MQRWHIRLLGAVLPLAVLAPTPAPASASTRVIPVISGHALTGSSPRFVKFSCALDRPLAASNAKVNYQSSYLPGHGGKVAHIVPPADAANGYGVVVSTSLSGLSGISVMSDGDHGMAYPIVQYPTSGGATMVGALALGNSGNGWATFKGLDQNLNWIRYANGAPAMQGSVAFSAIVAKFRPTGPASVGFAFGCDTTRHDFELDNLVVSTRSGARVYDFETSRVTTRIALSSPRKVQVGKRITLRGSLAPAAARIPIGIYTVKHHKRHLLKKVRTTKAGRFAVRVTFKHPGRVVWSAAVLRKQPWVTGSSGTRKISVKPKPKPKPKPAPQPAPAPAPAPAPTPAPGGGSSTPPPPPPPSGCTSVICSG